MLAAQVHRGPDDVGVWSDPDGLAHLGHRRLSIIDLSPAGHQPMVLADGAYAITYNGEIYNYRELRRALEVTGVRFRSSSDTEVLLHAYAAWGPAMLDRLVGMFAFAIWDSGKKELFLARDRAGEKPLYYGRTNAALAFASELQALVDVPDIDCSLDRDALAMYLEYQYVPAPKTIYKGIAKLPPAHAMLVDTANAPRIWRYWDPLEFALQPRLDINEQDAAKHLEQLLQEAVRGQLLADVPVGAFLSGGIDSSAVVAAMVGVSSSKVKTFTIGFDIRGYDESEHGERVARHLGTDHTVEFLSEDDAIDLVPRVATMYGEPFADSSALPTHLVSRVARKRVTVALSGDGGDEAFGGYSRYFHLIGVNVPRMLARPVRGPLRALRPLVFGRARRFVERLAESDRERFRKTLTVVSADHVVRLTGTRGTLAEFERAWDQRLADGAYRHAMLADMLAYLPEAILVKVDRAAMAVSLETRAPLLDHRILEFSLRLPLSMVRRKRLLKTIAYRRIPKTILDRPKQGFGVPIGHWFRGRLRDLLRDMLSTQRLHHMGIVDMRLVERYVRDHLTGRANYETPLWALLMLSLWDQERSKSRPSDQELTLAAS
jgi:asparagine synthase (glutamine-hydrolysing)